MGYHLIGAEAAVTSWGSANHYATLLTKISPHQANFTHVTDDHDVTGLGGTNRATLPGLYRSRVSIRSRWASTPRLGNVGFVSASGGTTAPYTAHVNAFELTIRSSNVHDITDMNTATASAPVFRAYRPDYLTWSGTYNCVADSSTLLVAPDVPTNTLNSFVFRYGDEATDDSITGTGMQAQLAQTIQVGSLSTSVYSFIGGGQLVPAGTTSAFGASGATNMIGGVPLWNQGGAAVGAMKLTLLSGGQVVTIADTFYESITIRCGVGVPVEIDVEVVGTGAVTYGTS